MMVRLSVNVNLTGQFLLQPGRNNENTEATVVQ